MSLNDSRKTRVAIVTGASSGIGAATAERLALAGYKVYGTSRKAASANNRSFEMIALDVTRNDSVNAAVSEVISREKRIDVLVNNAGFNLAIAGAEESTVEQAQALFNTNFFGVVRMTCAVAPHMRAQRNGRIIHIGSILGFLPAPYMALYAATKHAIEGYSQSIDHELRNWGIRSCVIEPAGTATNIDANAPAADAPVDAYRQGRSAVAQVLSDMINNGDDPNVVAEVVLKAANVARPKLRYTAGKTAWRLRLIRDYAPTWLVDSAIRKQMKLNALAKR